MSLPADARHFNKGDYVEVLRSEYLWFPATVLLLPSSNQSNKFYVEFETIKAGEGNNTTTTREYVNVDDVRPVPPVELHRFFKAGEVVDAYIEKEGWRSGGKIEDILENSKYKVSFDHGKQVIKEVDQMSVRLHRDWDHGSWIPPLQLQYLKSRIQNKSSELEARPRELKLKIKFSRQTSVVNFCKGMLVEVKSDEEGYRGSWYTAEVIGPVGNDKFSVEYQMLKTDDESEFLREDIDASCIRPFPPRIPQTDRFKHLERVDAWYNDGWWVGHISRVLDGFQYLVYFGTTNEEILFEHSKLRSHQEWVDGKWASASKHEMQSCSPDLKANEFKFKIKCSGRISVPKFSNGTMVEVKSDEEGYQGSWYPAVIVDSIGNDKFLVKYKTLKTDDESELLKEKTDASDVRPCPPVIQRLDRFKMLEEVDAWYNDGWWMGLIYKVLDGLKYAVYFWSTNEELEFDHFNLRPHQEWIDGKWVISFRRKPKLAVKPTIAKMKVPYGGGASIAHFCNGTRVEVKSGEEDYVDIWFPAIILGPVCNGKYLVEYLTLRTTDDGTKLLKEEVDAPRIRPRPCVIQRVERFKPLEEVDAWYGGGWWVGQVYKVFVGSNYTVYFRSTNEVLEFQHSYLRPHQDWTNGNWITATWGTDLMNSE